MGVGHSKTHKDPQALVLQFIASPGHANTKSWSGEMANFKHEFRSLRAVSVLLFQRTGFQFPIPMKSGSQPLATPLPGHLIPSFGFFQYLYTCGLYS